MFSVKRLCTYIICTFSKNKKNAPKFKTLKTNRLEKKRRTGLYGLLCRSTTDTFGSSSSAGGEPVFLEIFSSSRISIEAFQKIRRTIINRLDVAGAVLQTHLLLID